jgi:AcrR family transcriptional regulator
VSTEPAAPRRPGRPRSATTHEAILDAAAALFAECGHGGMSVEAVADRASTSKATIYRWWDSKEALLVEALEHHRPRLDFTPSGDPRRDLVDLLVAMIELLPPRHHSPIARLIGAMADSEELATMLRERFVGRRREQTMRLLRAAIDARELAADLDLELAADQLVGPILYRHLVTGDPLDTSIAERLVADLYAAHPPTPQEGP